ncbi:unnamed protein product, partial [Urochloa humidicola]
ALTIWHLHCRASAGSHAFLNASAHNHKGETRMGLPWLGDGTAYSRGAAMADLAGRRGSGAVMISSRLPHTSQLIRLSHGA